MEPHPTRDDRILAVEKFVILPGAILLLILLAIGVIR